MACTVAFPVAVKFGDPVELSGHHGGPAHPPVQHGFVEQDTVARAVILVQSLLAADPGLNPLVKYSWSIFDAIPLMIARA